jgi:PIN domain nuclease of toxin-antitoxin system
MILLDTHVWVWWVSGGTALSARAIGAIESAVADRSILVSSISAWEVATLVQRGRLELTMDVGDWIARSEGLPFLSFIPVDNRIAVRATRLDEYPHKDPADRIIVSTAQLLGARLVSRDERLRRYPHVETIW